MQESGYTRIQDSQLYVRLLGLRAGWLWKLADVYFKEHKWGETLGVRQLAPASVRFRLGFGGFD